MRRERERKKTGCKLIVDGLDIITKKLCERDKWAMY